MFENTMNKTADVMQHALEVSKSMAEQQARMSIPTQLPFTLEMTPGPFSFPYFAPRKPDEAKAREAFHKMAELNLQAWSITAEAIAAMPSWMKAPYQKPGEMMADWFDTYAAERNRRDPFVKGPNAVETVPAETADAAPAPVAAPAGNVAAKALEPVDTPEPSTKDETANTSDTPVAPELFSTPKGEADDLTLIKGVGPKVSEALNAIGVHHFWQIAGWTPQHVAWLDDAMNLNGRITRGSWVEQAQALLPA